MPRQGQHHPGWPLFYRSGLVATAFAVACIVFFRALAIGPPVVFADEATYATHILLFRDSLFELQMPNILYFALYSWTPALGVNFQVAVKFLNAAMVGFAFLAIYATARGFVERGPAYIIAIVAALSPITSSAAYVMPESLNLFAFWVVAWCVTVAVPRDFMRGSIVCGIAAAALTSIKPHGLVVTGAAVAAIAVSGLVRRDAPIRIVKALAGLMVAFFLARYVIAFATTGSLAFSWFGKLYTASLSASSSFAFASILGPVFWFCLAGHLLLLAFVVLPTVALGFRPGLPPRPDLPPGSLAALMTFAVLTLGLLLGMTVKFTVDTRGFGPYESAGRLHGRLYEFALPLLVLILAARQTINVPLDRKGRATAIVLLITTTLVALAAIAFGKHYSPGFVDFPVASWILSDKRNLAFAVAGLAIVSIAFLLRGQRAGVIACCATLVAMVAWGDVESFRSQRAFAGIVGEQDRSLAALAMLVPEPARNDGAVVARANSPVAFRAKFHALSRSPIVVVDKDSIGERDVPPGRKWLLLVDPYWLGLKYISSVASASGFQLVQLADIGLRVIDGSGDGDRRLSLAVGGGARAEGFHRPESWGSWTRGTEAKVFLGTPVSGRVRVQLLAHAFAGNAGRPLTITLGTEQRELKLGPEPSLHEWDFDLRTPADTVVISGMLPVSPLSIGVSSDDRELGVGVGSLAVRQREGPPVTETGR